MHFRKLIITLLVIVSILFSWNLICTWKTLQLQSKYKQTLYTEDKAAIEKALIEDYGKNNPVWETPWGGYTYSDIRKRSIRPGKDFEGGYRFTGAIDQQNFLETLGKSNSPKFKQAIKGTKKIVEKDASKSFLDTFYEVVAKQGKGSLATYFSHAGVKDDDSDARVKDWLKKELEEALKKAEKTLDHRLNPTQEENNTITLGNHGTVEIEAGFGNDKETLKELITKPGKFNLHEVIAKGQSDPLRDAINKALKEKANKGLIAQDVEIQESTLIGQEGQKSYVFYGYQPKDKEVIKEVASNTLGKYQGVFFKKEKSDKGVYLLGFVKKSAKYSAKGFDVKEAKVEMVKNANEIAKHGSDRSIAVTLKKDSAERLEKFTGSEDGGLAASKVNPIILAMVLDDELLMAPKLDQKLRATFQITGVSGARSKVIAETLNAGAMPAKLKISSQNTISPSLGKAAIQKGLWSILIALLLLFLLMGIYYATAGLVANAALLLNIVFILGAIAQLNGELTMASIAGILLTLGMAVDANIIIFSGARAALAEGKNAREAARYGHQNAYKSLFDSNVTTLLAGIILMYFGTTTIANFAKTLIIGLITSFITSVIVTQLLFDLLFAVWGPRTSISFSLSFTRLFKNINVDLIGRRKIAYMFSLLFLATGLGILSYKQLEVSTEFTGGSQYVVRFDDELTHKKQKITAGYLEEGLKKAFGAGSSTHVYGFGERNMFKINTNHRKDEADGNRLDEQVYNILYEITGKKQVASNNKNHANKKMPSNSFKIESQSKIGGAIAGATRSQSIWAILFALLGMLLYIFVSFNNLGFALAALIALVHDILAIFACIGFAKLFGSNYELDLTLFICALMIFGYSINDTILFFISLKNQMPKGSTDIGPYINRTLSITFERIFMTSFTTALPLVILFFFGGVGLKSFSFSLLCGVIWGTYSSVVATPLAYDINKGLAFFARKWGRGQSLPKKVQR